MTLPKFSLDKATYRQELLKGRAQAERSLGAEQEHLANYQQSKVDKMFGYSAESGRDLVRSHIFYYQEEIKTIDNELRLLETPGLLCEGAVTHILLKWLGKKVDEYHHERGHLGSSSGGGSKRRIIVTTGPDHWNQEADRMIETIQAGGWEAEVEPYEIGERKLISIKIPILELPAQDDRPSDRPIDRPKIQKSLFEGGF